jgi:2,4-dienoyl-CoA reductase-like NADH-dependent reductase (Old Yellow Enzyme family)
MAKLSDTLEIRGKTVKNRLAFLPCVTFSFHGDGGDYFGGQHLEHYARAAEGGAGIVYVQGTGSQGAIDCSGQWTEGSMRTLAEIASAIHSRGALAMIQLSWGGDRETDPNALTTDELLFRQKELLAAALHVGELGFDGFEFHFGHGFLLCKLFDAETNGRTDRFGGSLEKRASVITDIIPEIREKNGAGFILAVRMGAFLPTLDNGLDTARLLESSGIDLLNITFSVAPPPEAPDGFPLSGMAYGGYLVKQAVSIPVIGVGGIKDRESAETLVEGGYADIAGVARGILADPNFPRKVLAGQPVYKCRGCRECQWFTDHAKCPARVAAGR